MQEKTLMLIKPDAVERNLTGAIINECERNDLSVGQLKMITASKSLVEKHYAELADKPFFPNLLDYITRGPLVAVILEGENAITRVRDLVGCTNPKEAKDNTLRALYGKDITENSVHASDSLESAEKEIALWFN